MLAAVLVMALASLASLGAAPAADSDWVVECFHSDLVIEPDGALRVVEAIDVDFQALTDRHGIFREIPVEYAFDDRMIRVFELTVLSVMDGAGRAIATETRTNGANVQLKIGEADRIVTGRQSYRIAYRVRGALDAYPDHDELYWNVNGAEWPVPMRAVTASVVLSVEGLERSACFEGPTGATGTCRLGPRTGTRAEFSASRALLTGEQLTIVAGFRKGAVPEPRPILRPRPRGIEEWFSVEGPRPLAAGLALLIGLGLVARTWRRFGRDAAGARGDTIVTEYEPPDGLRPAQLGVLEDERADPRDATATIVDLAVRGHLVIEEVVSKGVFGLGGGTDWSLSRTAADRADLLPYEVTILEGLFASGPVVKLLALRGPFATTLDAAQNELYRDATARGWFAGRPDEVRLGWIIAGIAAIVLGFGLTVVLGLLVSGGLVGLAAVIAGLALVALAPRMPRRTAAGREELRRLRGFRRYLEVAETDRQRFVEQSSLFSDYLPYAIVFGCVDRWARRFSGIYAEGMTASWYHGGSALGTIALASSLSGFASQVSSSIASRPAGSGFSGGSSGGGGGGGGGGSW